MFSNKNSFPQRKSNAIVGIRNSNNATKEVYEMCSNLQCQVEGVQSILVSHGQCIDLLDDITSNLAVTVKKFYLKISKLQTKATKVKMTRLAKKEDTKLDFLRAELVNVKSEGLLVAEELRKRLENATIEGKELTTRLENARMEGDQLRMRLETTRT